MNELLNLLNQVGQKNHYSLKIYNALGISMMSLGHYSKAEAIYTKGLEELKLETKEGQTTHIKPGNKDLITLLVNFLKCKRINGASENLDLYSK